jgi:hypothetical protein
MRKCPALKALPNTSKYYHSIDCYVICYEIINKLKYVAQDMTALRELDVRAGKKQV